MLPVNVLRCLTMSMNRNNYDKFIIGPGAWGRINQIALKTSVFVTSAYLLLHCKKVHVFFLSVFSTKETLHIWYMFSA